MNNISFFLDYSKDKDFGFFIDNINPIIYDYLLAREENDYPESVRKIGLLSESLLKELYKLFVDGNDDPSFSTAIYELKNSDSLNVKLSPPIETILRFTINLRNISSHKTNNNLRDFILLSDEIKVEECIVAEKMIIKIMKWFLANKGFDISNIPNYTYLNNEKTLTQNFSIPLLRKDTISFKSTQIPEGSEIHTHSMIIDYLIRGMSLEDISNKYFNSNDDEGKISYRILFGTVGINKQWQDLFKNNNYRDILNLLDSNDHKIINEALNLHIKKQN
jgi:hypothetical protein